MSSPTTGISRRSHRFQERIEGLRQFDVIAEASVLPNASAEASWEAIHIAHEDKQRLVNHALVTLRLRGQVPTARLPLHGVTLLVGPPGTGKTTLARGLGSPIASALGAEMLYLEINAQAGKRSSRKDPETG